MRYEEAGHKMAEHFFCQKRAPSINVAYPGPGYLPTTLKLNPLTTRADRAKLIEFPAAMIAEPVPSRENQAFRIELLLLTEGRKCCVL
jgi:hypothetical protein